MAKIEIKQGDGKEPRELAQSIVQGQTLPFMAKITHKSFKALVVPSTGLVDPIKPGESPAFKIKSFEQAWVLVTDSAALAERYKHDGNDFMTIEVPDVAQVEAPAVADTVADADAPATTKKTKAAVTAAVATNA